MKFVDYKVEPVFITPEAEKLIEQAGRTCYKSEAQITDESSAKFISNILKRGHESVLEHASASFRITTNRFSSHQLVRHRLFGYSQESQRYCNYSKDKFGNEISFVVPLDVKERDGFEKWVHAIEVCEKTYFELIEAGWPPEAARSVLPSATKTEIVMSGNFRSWRHFLSLRLDSHAQKDAQFVASLIYGYLFDAAPNVFEISSLERK